MSQHGYPGRLSNRTKGFQDEGQSQRTMELLVETLTGTAFEMTVSPSDTIYAIKSKICRVEGIPVRRQHLLYNLQELEDSRSLAEQRVGDGARLRLVLGMAGGPVATRRVPLPEPWHDLDRIFDYGGEYEPPGELDPGRKVTVLLFREGDRVNMVRVRENRDGSYTPVETTPLFAVPPGTTCVITDAAGVSAVLEANTRTSARSAASSASTPSAANTAGAALDNAVTMNKMSDLRRRMESLSIRRNPARVEDDSRNMQKTESEKTPDSRSDDPYQQFQPKTPDARPAEPHPQHPQHPVLHQRFESFSIENTPVYDYTSLGREIYDYDCPFPDDYSFANSESSIPEAVENERLSSTLAGPILVKGGRDGRSAVGEILDQAKPLYRQDPSQLSTKRALSSIPAGQYGAAFGSESSAFRPARSEWRADAAPNRYNLSASTPQLDRLPTRLLPALSRYRNRSHLHLSDGDDHGHDHGHSHGHDQGHGHGRQNAWRQLPPTPPQYNAPPPQYNALPPLYTVVPSLTPFTHCPQHEGPSPCLGPVPLPYVPCTIRPPPGFKYPSAGRLASEPRAPPSQLAPSAPSAPSAPLVPLAPLSKGTMGAPGRRHGNHADPPVVAPVADPTVVDEAPAPAGRLRCQLCRRRLSVATLHVCRCGGRYCAPHRYAEVHRCYYDYRAAH